MLYIGLRVPKYFVIARVYRGTDVIPFALNNSMFIDTEALSSDGRFTHPNLLFGDEAKRDTDGAPPTGMRELNEVFSVCRVRDD